MWTRKESTLFPPWIMPGVISRTLLINKPHWKNSRPRTATVLGLLTTWLFWSNLKNALWRRASFSQSLPDWPSDNVETKLYRWSEKIKIIYFKEEFLACGSDTKKFWKTIKQMENKLALSHLPTSMKFSNKQRMATLFNRHFVKSYIFDAAVINTNLSFIPTQSSNAHSFSLQYIMVLEVLDELIKFTSHISWIWQAFFLKLLLTLLPPHSRPV